LTPVRIAIVDDDCSLLSALDCLLRSHGYGVSAHGSAEAFLASSDLGRVDCIISDINMPGMDGFAFKRRLDAIGDRTPMIMITGRTHPEQDAQVAAAGAYGPLAKPFQADALLDSIGSALSVRGQD